MRLTKRGERVHAFGAAWLLLTLPLVAGFSTERPLLALLIAAPAGVAILLTS